MAGTVIEAMAAESMYTMTPAYYEISLTQKYMRDEDSVEMLDIILATTCYDLGYIYNWGNLYGHVRAAVYKNTGDIVSRIEKVKDAFDTELAATVDKYIEAAK